eukprot:2445653-Amphidinium_carterae.1
MGTPLLPRLGFGNRSFWRQCICCSNWGCPEHLVAPACMDGNYPMCLQHPHLDLRPGADFRYLVITFALGTTMPGIPAKLSLSLPVNECLGRTCSFCHSSF